MQTVFVRVAQLLLLTTTTTKSSVQMCNNNTNCKNSTQCCHGFEAHENAPTIRAPLSEVCNRGKKYGLFDELKTFFQAARTCCEYKGMLAEVLDANESLFLRSTILGTRFWVGGIGFLWPPKNTLVRERTFKWITTGATVNLPNFDINNAPPKPFTTESCLGSFSSPTQHWNDWSCQETLAFICYYPAALCP